MLTPSSDHRSLLASLELELDRLTDESSDSNNSNSARNSQPRSYKLRLFPLRAVALVFGPLFVVGYYAFMWRLIQSRKRPGKPLYGYPNEVWIHYGWFVVGVFSLNFSKYGLLGIEASMLHDCRWQVKTAKKLLMHCESTWSGPGRWMKGSRPGRIIGPGVVPPISPGILLALWTAGCSVLGCTYGFRRRWSEILDGYSMFRFGADFAGEVHGESDFVSTRGFEECEALNQLPGLVGDSQPMMDIGHISLVKRGNEPMKGKRYH